MFMSRALKPDADFNENKIDAILSTGYSHIYKDLELRKPSFCKGFRHFWFLQQ